MKPLFKLFNILAAGLMLTLSASVIAGGLGPDIPAPVKGEECVADTQEMRVNHMKYLKGHRDEVLRQGIRTKQYNLSECLECHVPAREEAQAMRSEGDHFCMSCHAFAGVKVDCFSCHATMPEKSAAFHPIVIPGMQALKDVHQAPSAQLLNELASRGARDE
jgi:predicted CXXCH cytochrome family protein